MQYRAKWVFPPERPPEEFGVVEIADDANGTSAEAVDLGDVALIPGLVNAHTHLEFSDLAGQLGTPGTKLSEWILDVVASRRNRASEGNKQAAIQQGLAELADCGTVAVGEIATLPSDFSWYQHATVEVHPFIERLSLDPGVVGELMQAAEESLAQCAGLPCGLSPHAPYSVHPDLLAAICNRAAELPVAMHLAESWDELELLQSGCGSMVQTLERLQAWNPAAIPRGIEIVSYLERLATAQSALVIHGNFLSDEELAFLAERRDTLTLVYCPRTHDFFGHGPHPFAELLRLGGNVALGTDSRASNPDLNVFEEARFVAEQNPQLDPQLILAMATSAGARALGVSGYDNKWTIVELAVDAPPDPYEALFSGSAVGRL